MSLQYFVFSIARLRSRACHASLLLSGWVTTPYGSLRLRSSAAQALPAIGLSVGWVGRMPSGANPSEAARTCGSEAARTCGSEAATGANA